MGDVFGGVTGKQDARVHEWEAGLPKLDDLTPLTRALIPPDLLSAFSIPLEPFRTSGDVSRATDDTISSIRGSNFRLLDENMEALEDEEIDDDEEGSGNKKARRSDSPEEGDSSSAKSLKRQRLVWTPQLHKRFVDVVVHLGIKNAVPKTIMQLMNVEGLTRENVASHLQKYRLYLKRMQGASIDTPANSSEKALSPSPALGHFPVNGNVPMPYGMMPIPMPMHIPMPVMHMSTGNYCGFGSNPNKNHVNHYQHSDFHHHHHQYNWNYAGGDC